MCSDDYQYTLSLIDTHNECRLVAFDKKNNRNIFSWAPASTKVGCKLKLESNCELNIRSGDNKIVWTSATAGLG